jgi:phosphosulfolactate synthase
MLDFAWTSIVESVLNDRALKPRRTGVTMVIDTGCGVMRTQDALDTAAAYIDHWKCGFGTSALAPKKVLCEKLEMLRELGVLTYPGGTLLEVALIQEHCRAFMRRAREVGFTAVEVSDGTISLPAQRRRNVINCALDAGLTPVTEVGKKAPTRQPTAVEMAEQALTDLEWGAAWVVIEARDSGKGVGIYDAGGAVREPMLREFCELMGAKLDRIIWEAPLPSQQAYLVRRFGANASLGNIAPDHVLAVEALRAGLRFETLEETAEHMLRTGQWVPEKVEPPLVNRSGKS